MQGFRGAESCLLGWSGRQGGRDRWVGGVYRILADYYAAQVGWLAAQEWEVSRQASNFASSRLEASQEGGGGCAAYTSSSPLSPAAS